MPIVQTNPTQPEKMKVLCVDPETGKRIKWDIIPDKGNQGPEWTMVFTYPSFKELFEQCLITGTNLWVYWLKCFQNKASIHWSTLVTTEFTPADTEQTDKGFALALIRFLEVIANQTHLKNSILRFMQNFKKPFVQMLTQHCSRRIQLYAYATSPLIRGNMDMPSMKEKKEPLFFAMVKSHQLKFAELHPTIGDMTWTKMVAKFDSLGKIDVNNGSYEKLLRAKWASFLASKGKQPCPTNPQGGRSGRVPSNCYIDRNSHNLGGICRRSVANMLPKCRPDKTYV